MINTVRQKLDVNAFNARSGHLQQFAWCRVIPQCVSSCSCSFNPSAIHNMSQSLHGLLRYTYLRSARLGHSKNRKPPKKLLSATGCAKTQPVRRIPLDLLHSTCSAYQSVGSSPRQPALDPESASSPFRPFSFLSSQLPSPIASRSARCTYPPAPISCARLYHHQLSAAALTKTFPLPMLLISRLQVKQWRTTVGEMTYPS